MYHNNSLAQVDDGHDDDGLVNDGQVDDDHNGWNEYKLDDGHSLLQQIMLISVYLSIFTTMLLLSLFIIIIIIIIMYDLKIYFIHIITTFCYLSCSSIYCSEALEYYDKALRVYLKTVGILYVDMVFMSVMYDNMMHGVMYDL